jgi:heme/copper-type cytochrome/quinol oxidase subunit 2
MNLLSFLSMLILAITLLTMVFGVIAYFLYKAREKKKGVESISYEEVLKEENKELLFFVKDENANE